ncbi:conjugal transfer protein TraF, partial [Cysteiniphilum sp. SYW-8]|uniref:conjugal transfer protein TraF n=1 Tax=Cysteiniphilum sp. SYW-8 TaxID=2610890 RepID=UPI001CD060D1
LFFLFFLLTLLSFFYLLNLFDWLYVFCLSVVKRFIYNNGIGYVKCLSDDNYLRGLSYASWLLFAFVCCFNSSFAACANQSACTMSDDQFAVVTVKSASEVHEDKTADDKRKVNKESNLGNVGNVSKVMNKNDDQAALAEQVLSDLLGVDEASNNHQSNDVEDVENKQNTENKENKEDAETFKYRQAHKPHQGSVESPIRQLADDHELVFFVSSQCQHCHQFATVIKALSEAFDFRVVSFSFDGKGVNEFPVVLPVVADQRLSYCQPYLSHSESAYRKCQFAQEIYRIYYGNATALTPVLFLQNKHTLHFELIAKGAINRELLHYRLRQKADAYARTRTQSNDDVH